MNLKIIGLKTTTTNENNKSMSDLGQIWGKFFSENIVKKLGGNNNSLVYAVYTNYKGDYISGDYDFYLGIENKNNLEIPNYSIIEINVDKYQEFEFDYNSPDDTINAWKEIWGNEKLDRAYKFDIEEYDYNNKKLKIYISIN